MKRYAMRVDASQQRIVDALRDAGVMVWVIGQPCDLLCRVKSDPPGVFRCLEAKTPTRTGKVKKDRRQLKQMEFMQVTGTPYVTTVEQALASIGAQTT